MYVVDKCTTTSQLCAPMTNPKFPRFPLLRFPLLLSLFACRLIEKRNKIRDGNILTRANSINDLSDETENYYENYSESESDHAYRDTMQHPQLTVPVLVPSDYVRIVSESLIEDRTDSGISSGMSSVKDSSCELQTEIDSRLPIHLETDAQSQPDELPNDLAFDSEPIDDSYLYDESHDNSNNDVKRNDETLRKPPKQLRTQILLNEFQE